MLYGTRRSGRSSPHQHALKRRVTVPGAQPSLRPRAVNLDQASAASQPAERGQRHVRLTAGELGDPLGRPLIRPAGGGQHLGVEVGQRPHRWPPISSSGSLRDAAIRAKLGVRSRVELARAVERDSGVSRGIGDHRDGGQAPAWDRASHDDQTAPWARRQPHTLTIEPGAVGFGNPRNLPVIRCSLALALRSGRSPALSVHLRYGGLGSW